MSDEETRKCLDKADAALTNLDEVSEAFDSAIAAARSAINAARATLIERNDG